MNSCSRCGKTFSNRWNLSRHVASVHLSAQSPMSTSENTYPVFQQGGSSPQEHIESENDSEMDDGRADTRERDVFEEDEDSDLDELKNSSDEDSDNCESSSDDSSDVEAQGEHLVSCDGDASQQPLSKYMSFARWRSNDTGLYGFWRSQSAKPFVVQHREWLNKLLKTPYKSLKRLIKEASESQLDAFQEIASNLMKGRAMMHTSTYRGFKPFVKAIEVLAAEESSYDEIRRILITGRGGLLPLLLLTSVPTCIKSYKVVFDDDQ